MTQGERSVIVFAAGMTFLIVLLGLAVYLFLPSANVTAQYTDFQDDGTWVTQRQTLNVADGTGVVATVTNDGANSRATLTIALPNRFQLPGSCTSGQVAKSSGDESWDCAADISGAASTFVFQQDGGASSAVDTLDIQSPLTSGVSGTVATVGIDTTGTWSGNAVTSTALAANPADCASNMVATTIAASGNLTCVNLSDSYIPNTITIDLAAAATALAANGANCSANEIPLGVDASGAVEGCYNLGITNVTGKRFAYTASIASPSADTDDNVFGITTDYSSTLGSFGCFTTSGTVTVSADIRALNDPTTSGNTVFSAFPCSTSFSRTTSFIYATFTRDQYVAVTLDASSSAGWFHIRSATGTIDDSQP